MDKFVNATRILSSLRLAKKHIQESAKNNVEKVIGETLIEASIRSIRSEIEKNGEFRRVVHAHWIGIDGSYKCSKCGSVCIEKADEWIDLQFGCDPVLFCPRCGAVMDEPTENYGYFPVPEDYE